MKIVIADDELWVRTSLVSMIYEMEASWEIVGEASHGRELVDIIAQFKPEVAIVDIRMPELDGLEAIRICRALSPQTKWIIVSGFSDFQYAHQAVKLGVTEYLLKPIHPEELEKAINSIALHNKEYALLLNQQFENELFSLTHGLTSLETESIYSPLRQGSFRAVVFYFDGVAHQEAMETMYGEFTGCMRKLFPAYLGHGVNLSVYTLTGTEFVVVGVYDPMRREAVRAVQFFLERTEEAAATWRKDHLAITCVRSEVCTNYVTYTQHLQQIQMMASIRAVFGVNRTWSYHEMMQRAQGERELGLSKAIMRLTQDYKNKLYLSYENTLIELEAHLSAMSAAPYSDQLRREIEQFVRIVFGFSLQGQVGEGWIRQWKERGEKLLRPGGEPVAQDLIQQVLSYIGVHYRSNIGLSQIASEMNVTTSYLSTLFHKKTGTTFIKYLTRLRILQAKELLCHTNLQIQQVAEQVGYYSARHFTKLFVDMVGVYPSEFKKSICQPEQDT